MAREWDIVISIYRHPGDNRLGQNESVWWNYTAKSGSYEITGTGTTAKNAEKNAIKKIKKFKETIVQIEGPKAYRFKYFSPEPKRKKWWHSV